MVCKRPLFAGALCQSSSGVNDGSAGCSSLFGTSVPPVLVGFFQRGVVLHSPELTPCVFRDLSPRGRGNPGAQLLTAFQAAQKYPENFHWAGGPFDRLWAEVPSVRRWTRLGLVLHGSRDPAVSGEVRCFSEPRKSGTSHFALPPAQLCRGAGGVCGGGCSQAPAQGALILEHGWRQGSVAPGQH